MHGSDAAAFDAVAHLICETVVADIAGVGDVVFGGDEVPSDEDGDPPTWWENFVESAVLYGTLPLLTNEIFGALDQMYSLAALPLAQGGGRARDLREILLSAVRVPSQYAWGSDLHQSFHARLREAMGANEDVLPHNWPDE